MNEETNQFINSLTKNNDFKVISFKSSLKICKVAEGLANIYPRFGPTMEWIRLAMLLQALQSV